MPDGMRVSIAPFAGADAGMSRKIATPQQLANAQRTGSTSGLPRQGLVFQCPPLDSFSYEVSHSHTDYETINTQYSHPGTPQLRTVQFDTLTVQDPNASFAVEDPGTPEEITQTLVDVCLSGEPFLLQATHALPSAGFIDWSLSLAGPALQMFATLRALTVTEKAGEVDALYYTCSFTEYRAPVVPTAGVGGRPGGKKYPQVAALAWDGSVRDASGRVISPAAGTGAGAVTLASLATKFYGDPAKASVIADANSITSWGNNDPLIQNKMFAQQVIGGSLKLTIPDPKAKQKVTAFSSVRGA